MKIYDVKGYSNPTRVRIALAEKDLMDKVQFITVDVPGGDHKKKDFLEKNPFGKVPVLELDDGTTISECSAITEYIDHIDGAPTLTGKTAKERAIIHMMQRRAEAELIDAVSAYFHHATPGLGPEIEEYQCKEWGEHQKARAVTGMKYLNDVLTKRPYLAGDNFSVADITAFAGLKFADFANVRIPGECVALIEWRARIAARPSVVAL